MISDYIEIPLDVLYDLNKYIYAMGSKKRYGWAMKHKSTDTVAFLVKNFINNNQEQANKFHQAFIEKDVGLVFEWHLKDKRKDPDNISSAGRKAILDGFQEAVFGFTEDNKPIKFLPNDSIKFIKGFSDLFVVDKANVVRIYPIEINKLEDNLLIENQ